MTNPKRQTQEAQDNNHILLLGLGALAICAVWSVLLAPDGSMAKETLRFRQIRQAHSQHVQEMNRLRSDAAHQFVKDKMLAEKPQKHYTQEDTEAISPLSIHDCPKGVDCD